MLVAVAHRQTAEPMGQELADSGLITALGSGGSGGWVTDLALSNRSARRIGTQRIPLAKLQRIPWQAQIAVGRWVYRGHDLVHRLDLGLPPAAVTEVLTIQDLAPLRFDDEGELPRFTARAVHRAAAVICPSRFSADEVRREYGREDVEVIPHGVDPAVLNARRLTDDERATLGLPTRWIIHAGGATTRKNLRCLAGAWPVVQQRHPELSLLLCGPSDRRRTALFEQLPGARLMGKVPRERLISLIASSAAVVVPSTYEGFGLPALEAMAVGVPLVACAAGSLPEVTGHGAILVDPEPAALAAGLLRALDGVSPALLDQNSNLARARTWDDAAKAYQAVYARVSNERR
jgi:glycosyltransferase involved in cell wall biosynthesis